jgi:hypothetical protein
MPVVFLARLFDRVEMSEVSARMPLSAYRHRSFTVIRNDARDRFGTPLEHRFSRSEVEQMMSTCGLTNIVVSSQPPFWHAIGKRTV